MGPVDLYSPHTFESSSNKHKYSPIPSTAPAPITPVSHVGLFNNNLPPTYSPTSLRYGKDRVM